MEDAKLNLLQEAWAKRKELWTKGSALIVEGNKLWEEIKGLPGAMRIGIWYSVSEMGAEAAAKVSAGYNLRMEADKIWFDAVTNEVASNPKATWTYDATAKGYDCTLETGEVFKA